MTWWDKVLGRWFCAVAALALSLAGGSLAAFTQEPGAAAPAPASCTKAEFETVVDDAAAALRELTVKNKPAFQDKLRQLKDKRGWSDDQFLKEAAPFVKDGEIEVYEKKSNELLGKISSMGEAGAKTPDCGMLTELHSFMSQLVDAQTAKWAYMFGKLEGELGR